ncbi:MAG: hypothetical protein WDZ91_03560 [Paenibacillaceae bacterium]
MEEIDLGEKINNTTVSFSLSPELWGAFDTNQFDLSAITFNEIKFLNDSNDDLHPDMGNIPNDKGGIYFFYIRSIIVPNTYFLVYIGRAWYTEYQNLRKRVRSYFQKYPNERPKINRMIRYWGPYLYIRYIEMTDNDIINDLEERLINSNIPPFNDKIPDKRIKDAVSAFNL